MTKGVGKNVVSIVRRKCPVCGWKQGKKSRARGKYIVYEATSKWILKCINNTCEGKIEINKREEDVMECKNNVIDETNINEKLDKLRGLVYDK